jgi:hypothetical protein
MIASNNMIARVAAVVAGLGLVAMSFASFVPAAKAADTSADLQAQITALLAQIAALQAQAGGSASASTTFTRDLTIGSSGADVTALQNWLIKGGFAIPAGATGYFGAQTAAALAKYQASVGISPAAGYFGPITRAKVNGSAGGTGTGTGTSTGGLSGGEANLTDFNLRGEDATGDEGEEGVDLATAEFDVEDGDVKVERIELTASSTNNSTLEDRPWKYFDTITVMADGKEIGDVDASDKDEWDGDDGVYTISFTGLDYQVDEDETAKITFSADIADSIDDADIAGQDFVLYVDENGVRAVDGEGIQQYTGDSSASGIQESVTFGFGAEDNGDLTVKSNSDDPDASILVGDASDESDDFEVFKFDIDNDSDADTIINDITIGVTTGNTTSAENIIRTATLEIDGDEFDGDIGSTTIDFDDLDLAIDGNDRVTGTLTVTLKANPVATTVVFTAAGSSMDAEGADSGDTSTVTSSQSSSTHTVALQGVALEAVSTSQSVVTPGTSASSTYGSYTIKFDVTAIEDDAYIASTTATSGTVGVTYAVAGSATYAGTQTALLSSTADYVSASGYYVVREGDTETFTLTVTLNPTPAGTFEVDLSSVRFNDSGTFTSSSVFTVDTNNEDYQTDPIYIAD